MEKTEVTKIAVETGDVDVHNTMLVVMKALSEVITCNNEYPVEDKVIVANTVNLLLNSIGYGMMRFYMIKTYENNDITKAFAGKQAFYKTLNITDKCIKLNDEIQPSGNSETFVLNLASGEVSAI